MAADANPPHDRRIRIPSVSVALLAVVVSLVIGLRWGTFAIGGSDSHCYAGQAQMLVEGRTALAPPVPLPVPWPNAAATFAPSGFAPGPGPFGGSVPLCPAGLPLLMAAALTIGGGSAIFIVVPLMGALAVWSTFVLGRRLVDPVVGAASAWLVACSPIFLYQVVQPMSDVPAAALWTASLAVALDTAARSRQRLRGPLAAGLLAGAAIMVRPNLAPLAVFPVALALPSRRAVMASVIGVLPGISVVALLQTAMYGSPLRSGYGELGQIFSIRHVAANLVNYPAWLATAHTPILALGLLAPIVARWRAAAWILLAFVLATFVAYLPYLTFTEWWYSRFLLPALPALIVLMIAVLARVARLLPAPRDAVALGLLTLALSGLWLTRANDLAVFRLEALERKYVELGRVASTRLPARAIVLAAQPTGSVRYHAHLPTLSWDAIDAAWLDRVLDECRSRGLVPYFALESWEADAFRSRFKGHSVFADLNWPPRAILGSVIFVYDPADRARYFAGEHVPTEYVSWPVR